MSENSSFGHAMILAAVLAGLLAGCDREPAGAAKPAPVGKAASSAPVDPAKTADPAPTAVSTSPKSDGAPTTLPKLDLAGLQKLVAESASRNEVVVIDFWATWCAPCVDLFPAMHEGVVKITHEHGTKPGGVRLISVTLDTPGELEDAAIAFLNKQNAIKDGYMLEEDVDKRLAVVDGLGKRWNNLVVPAILVFGKDGRLAHEFFERDRVEDMLAKISALVAGQTNPANDSRVPVAP